MKTRFRTNWRGKLILQVLVEVPAGYSEGEWEPAWCYWRDAKLSDFPEGFKYQ